ncbi:DUF6178 family protein [Vitiosangium sp. GDMCC 1.1324]|uniref:DUF6178 family protein n=1 Tax=Vitiosangium sp. (strain GDMCC 1.1324) TaxID=2138576 RepID=UPI000D359038|nr:DUF6178 family protein [Vitiosangium sp. GDMCC 1.1324]PTL82013.1 hypothetical protein DAT35_19565 [Vitiosangium sp. GDMCC 1.1324]
MTTSQLLKGPGTRSLLYRILESPEQVSALQHLPPPTLARLIHHVGLEDAGELVALATTQQLARIFDEDLWRSTRPGREERFDAERFGLWLEVLLEMGADRAAARLAEMDEDFVTFALSGQLLVLDLDMLTMDRLRSAEGQEDEALVDKALESSLSHELDRFLLISRKPESWDAVLSVLVALDESHHELLTRLLERCCHHASEYIEDNGGLYAVLTTAEQLETDVAQAREERREREGFVAPADAAAFLGLARSGRVGEDPITRGYARAQQEASRVSPSGMEGAPHGRPVSTQPLLHLLQEAEVLTTQSPTALLGAGGDAGTHASATTLREALDWLQGEAPEALSRCTQELGYLSNVLVSGCGHSGRALRALEAAQVAIATCNLGMEVHPEIGSDRSRAGGLIAREGLVPCFGRGWRVLHEDVVMWSARAFDAALTRRVPAGRGDASRARTELARDIAAGRPWASRRRWVHLAPFLSKAAFAAMRELVDECPAFNGTFLATRQQVEEARRRVEELLAS